jgi:hypothetical protein
VTEAGLKRALLTFAVSRGLNGVISVVQGTEVAVEPVGIGMTFTPGQILDPVNDLVERFSTVVLVAGTAFGIQRVALEAVAANFFLGVLALSIGLSIALLWIDKAVPIWLSNLVYKSCLVLIIIRFAIPLLALAGDGFYQHFLASQFASSSQQLQLTSSELSALKDETSVDAMTGSNGQADSDAEPDQQGSFFANARKLYRSATSTLDFQRQIDRFKNAADAISEHAIRLMVVFILQTLLLPLLSVWLILKAIKAVTGMPLRRAITPTG